MAKINNILLVLTMLLVLISLFSTVALMDFTRFETPADIPGRTAKGQLKLTIEPGPGSDTEEGRVLLNIEPS